MITPKTTTTLTGDNVKPIEYIVLDKLEPSFVDMMDDSLNWHGYGMELCYLGHVLRARPEMLVEELNETLAGYRSTSGKYTAACDVASTLESLAPEKYAGKFRY